MRIQKKIVKKAKADMQKRVAELCKLEDPDWLKVEYKLCFPEGLEVSVPEMRRILLMDVIERALPDHWFF